MSELKATPGPWRVQPMKNGIEHEILHGEYYVAATFGGCFGEARPGSNAYLIAAAPELYAALEEAVASRMNQYGRAPHNWISALAKARGES